ncbi:unnamed protein product [Prunus armeniaca]|uniref:Uncharacterized protein n=1 Tax=Prunus armeniaca TaxID=36596 RepID=A0A6J5XII7_PRUAR|nr:unnamed protein product [Prunus armeniaca]
MRKPCCEKTEITKGAWSKQEDQKLIDYIQKHGEGCWNSLPKAAGLRRCGKSCRLRWINYLRPDLKRGSFGEDEEDLIIRLHALLGNRWSLIAGRLPGRTDNEVKNYWNSHIRKKLVKMGTTATTSTALDPKKPHHRDNKVPLLMQPDARNPILFRPPAKTMDQKRAPKHDDEMDVSDSMSINGGNQLQTGVIMSNKSFCLPDLNLDLTLSLQLAVGERHQSDI